MQHTLKPSIGQTLPQCFWWLLANRNIVEHFKLLQVEIVSLLHPVLKNDLSPLEIILLQVHGWERSFCLCLFFVWLALRLCFSFYVTQRWWAYRLCYLWQFRPKILHLDKYLLGEVVEFTRKFVFFFLRWFLLNIVAYCSQSFYLTFKFFKLSIDFNDNCFYFLCWL